MKNGKYVEDGVEVWYKDDMFHRDNGPAVITYYEERKIREERWMQNGICHRENGPAKIFYCQDGKIREAKWYQYGQMHREDGPAQISYDVNDGSLRLERWCYNGSIHRDNGPAVIFYCANRQKVREIWYKNDQVHREDGPAIIEYDEDGKVNGPALIAYYKTGNQTEQKYYLNGVVAPEWLVMTSAGALDPNHIFDLGNAEQRREFVRKIGLERVIDSLGKVVDTDDNYQLIDLKITYDILNEVGYRPYLKMINPSTGDVHIEGVHPDCETVQQALNWRNGRTDKPVVIT